jgi:hypothetical protein
MSERADPTSQGPGATSEEGEAWARVLASWADEEAHRAYLARLADMDGYAAAGARYRAVLAGRPEDAMALRMRDEVVRKATVFGLASLPRTRRSELPRWARRVMLVLALLGGAGVVGLVARIIHELVGARS